MTDLGKVGVMPKGEYVEGTSYEMLDLVHYDGSSYLALIDTTVRPIDDGINWMLIVQGTPTATTEVLGKVKPDGTTITISEDGTITGAKQVPDNVLVAVEVGEDDPDLPPLQAPQIDADRLGGELPEHYATKESVTNVKNQIGALEELSTTDKTTLVKAINELFTELSGIDADELENSITGINDVIKNAGLNVYNLGSTKWDNIEKNTYLPTTFFTNWTNETELPALYGSGVIIPGLDGTVKFILYVGSTGGAAAKRFTWLGYMKFSDVTVYTITWRKLISDEELPELVSNPNILINTDFRNPINQRGVTNIHNNNRYFIDRWKTEFYLDENGNSVYLDADGVHIKTGTVTDSYVSIVQYMENKLEINQTYTFSAKINGIVYSSHFIGGQYIGSGFLVIDNGKMRIFYVPSENGDRIIIRSYELNFDYTIEWAKLESGRIATTFIPPNSAEELEKCRYYYQEFAGTYLFNSGGKTSGKYVSHMLYCNKMRTLPTVSYKGTLNNTGSIYVADTLGGNKSREIQTLELKASQFGNQYRIGAIVTPTDTSTLAAYGSSSNEQIVFTGSARVVLDAEIY